MKNFWKMNYPSAILACAVAAMPTTLAYASQAGLSVEPVLLNLEAPAAASFVTLHNSDSKAMSVQTRVFRWAEHESSEDLQPASDVAVSPPIATIGPDEDFTVRVVRVIGTPVQGEESYRLWIDQLPDGRHRGHAGLNILIRQSIPVFFHAPDMAAPSLTWSVRKEDGKLLVEARNTGDAHMRIVGLQLRDATGASLSFGAGLIGYVLGHSSLTFTVPHPPRGFGAGGTISIAAKGDAGKIDATEEVRTVP